MTRDFFLGRSEVKFTPYLNEKTRTDISIMISNTSYIIRWTLLAYILQRHINHANGIHCYLCEGDDTTKLHSDSSSAIDGKSCSDLATEAFDVTFDDDRCSEYYQLLGYSSCDCEIIPENEKTSCSLCPNGDDIDQNFTDILWFSNSLGASTTCQEVSEYVKRFDESTDECTQFQFSGISKCGCNIHPQETSCTLCQGGEDPPFLSPIGYDELSLSCEQMATGAQIFHKDSNQCLETQYYGALNCECPYELPDEPVCNLCMYGDRVPESHTQNPYFPGQSILTCEQMEIMTAFDGVYEDESKCKEAQVIAEIFCGCQRTEWEFSSAPSSLLSTVPSSSPKTFPTNAPSLAPTFSPTTIISFIPTAPPSIITSILPTTKIPNVPSISPTYVEQPKVTSSPTSSPTSSSVSPFLVNCTALSSGNIPTSIHDGANLNTIDLYSGLVLSNGYNVASIQDNLLNALQHDVGPLIAGCSKSITEGGNRRLNDDNETASNILFVVFKKLEKQGTQSNCATNQNCPIVKMIIDVVYTNNPVEIYEKNRVLFQEYDTLEKDSLFNYDTKSHTQNEVQRKENRELQSKESSNREIVKQMLKKESGSLKVPGLLAMTYLDSANIISNIKRPVSTIEPEDERFPIWGVISIAITAGLSIISMFAYSHKDRYKSLNTSNHGKDDQFVVSTEEEFKFCDESDEESLRGLKFFVRPGDDIADNKPIEVTINDYIKDPVENKSVDLDKIVRRLSKSYHESYYQSDSSRSIVSKLDMIEEQQGYKLQSSSFSSNRDTGPTENTVEL